MNYILSILVNMILFTAMTIGAASAGDFVAIVHNSNKDAIDKSTLRRIYLGQMQTWQDGHSVNVLDVPDGSPLRKSFLESVISMTPSQFKSHWVKKLFSGRGQPPRVISESEVKKFVASNSDAIGYIDESLVDGSVRAINLK